MRQCDQHYINGEWIKPFSERHFEVINPATEQSAGSIILANTEDELAR